MFGLVPRCVSLGLALALTPALAQKRYDPGASETEIKIGQTMPYSGPVSAYGTAGRVEAAYIRKINDEGGVNGRKITLISLDDGYSPPKTVEMVRRLVEHDHVLFLFQTLGTPTNVAVQKYLNANKVPQLFVASGATRWNDPKAYPWTMGLSPSYQAEARVYAQHILKTRPTAKVAVLYQNDDYGKDYLLGFKQGLGSKAQMIVAEATYEPTDPSVQTQIVQLHSSGADTLFIVATPKFAAQAIRNAYDIGWKPVRYLNNVAISVPTVLEAAGLDRSVGVISTAYFKDPTDRQWRDDVAMREWSEFMRKYYPEGSVVDYTNVVSYAAAQTLIQVLKQCGDDLTRDNVMRQAANLKDVEIGVLLPGVKVRTSPSDYAPIESMQLMRFDGQQWVRFGEVLGQ